MEIETRQKIDLICVMPVYNEQDCIQMVIADWLTSLRALEINFRIYVINDGSTDDTFHCLQEMENEKELNIINQVNRGHGPSILRGYSEAVNEAEWVFQCDSDNEIDARCFASFWNQRKQYDAILGYRIDREQNSIRKFISLSSRIVVNLFFGRNHLDVNVPFRLIKSKILQDIIISIPDKTFAPNIILTSYLVKNKVSWKSVDVLYKPRQTGDESIKPLKMLKLSFKCLFQTLKWKFLNS